MTLTSISISSQARKRFERLEDDTYCSSDCDFIFNIIDEDEVMDKLFDMPGRSSDQRPLSSEELVSYACTAQNPQLKIAEEWCFSYRR